MTFDEAYSEAIQGAWVRAVDMQPGSYISYNFNGLRINFEGGSSSGWTPRDRDRKAEWEICGPPEVPKPSGGLVRPGLWAKPETAKWGTTPTRNPEPQRDKWGRPV
jgi:hypothetical protein